jgi:hypothetical protein
MTTEESPEAPPARATRRWPTSAIVACAVLATVLVGVVAFVIYSGTLYFKDPAGAKACSMLSDAIDRGDLRLQDSMDIGDVGKHSTTPAIRATVHLNPKAGPDLDALALLDELHAACVESGVHMPAYTEKGSP